MMWSGSWCQHRDRDLMVPSHWLAARCKQSANSGRSSKTLIRESSPWKNELRRLKRALAHLAATALPEDMADFKIEKPVHYSAMVMRRLIECGKVTDKTRSLAFEIAAFPSRPDRHDSLFRLMMSGEIDEEFDLKAATPLKMDCWNICNELLHSGFINWEVDQDGKLSALYVASIRNHVTRLIRIPMTLYLCLIDTVLHDRVVGVSSSIHDGKLRSVRYS
jgi:hypothetical protein